MKEHFELKARFAVEPSKIYAAWLNSSDHGAMTGGGAKCTDFVGGKFTAWDKYIKGENIELIENQKIVQTWRTVEFKKDDEDSLVTVLLKPIDGGTEITLTHTNIPEGQTQYETGWVDNYFEPMQDFFM